MITCLIGVTGGAARAAYGAKLGVTPAATASAVTNFLAKCMD